MSIDYKKYAVVQVKVTKKKDTQFGGLHPNGINEGYEAVGTVMIEASENIGCLCVDKTKGGYLRTSPVEKIVYFEGYDEVHTRNSIYRVEPIISAVPGVQEKVVLSISDL